VRENRFAAGSSVNGAAKLGKKTNEGEFEREQKST
jgi:hypothetical protein